MNIGFRSLLAEVAVLALFCSEVHVLYFVVHSCLPGLENQRLLGKNALDLRLTNDLTQHNSTCRLSMRWITLTHSAKVNTVLILEFEVEATVRTVQIHLQLYTLISYIFVVQCLYKRWFKVTQAYNMVYVYSATSGSHWSRLAGSR